MTITANLPASVARSGIHREPLTPDLCRLLRPLMEANHAAAGVDAPLDPDLWLIQGMQPRVWVVWHEGRPVGYCAHIISRHPLTQEMHATCLAIYIDPAHRPRAFQLIRRAEADLAGHVSLIAYNLPHMTEAGVFFERMGYDCRELVMAKRIGDKP